MSRKSERRVGAQRCGAVLLAVLLLSGCGDGGVKQGSGADVAASSGPVEPSGGATSLSASSSASGAQPVPASSGASSGVATSPATSSVAPTTAASSSPSVASSSTEPTATATTDAEGTVLQRVPANRMPTKPAAPPRVELPAVAYSQTKTGAMVVAAAFFKELAYLQSTGDDQYFQSFVALDVCVECKRLSDGAISTYKEGGFAIVDRATLSNGTIVNFEPDLARVQFDIQIPGPVSYYPAKGLRHTYASVSARAVVDVQWIENRWVVTYYVLVGK